MNALQVSIMLIGVVVLCVAALQLGVAFFLWYCLSRIQPLDDLETRIMRNSALCESLEAQVAKLRTSKAGRVSNAKRVAEQQAPPEEEDPFLDGLTEEDKALFR